MATEKMPDQDSRRDGSASNSPGATILPSQRAVIPPAPGTEEAAFLANLNEVYGEESSEDDQMVEDVRRYMRTVLTDQ
jgi:hypothetical protein